MNDRSKKIWGIAAVVIALMALIPPWKTDWSNEGWRLLFLPPEYAATVDIARLLLQVCVVVAIAFVVDRALPAFRKK